MRFKLQQSLFVGHADNSVLVCAISSGITSFGKYSHHQTLYTVTQTKCAEVMQYRLQTQQLKSVNKLDHEQPAAEASDGNYLYRNCIN